MSGALKTPRIALVHDWLTGMRGGERVLEVFCKLLPQADLLTLIHVPGSTCPAIENRVIRTSGLNRLPGVRKFYRHLLPLMPRAIESLDTSSYDLLVSTSHCVAKGVRRHDGQLHVCYCFTPMRYIWSTIEDYHSRLGLAGLALKAIAPNLRKWDRRTAGGVDLFIADSACVAGRIASAYDRDSVVLHPAANVDFFTPADVPREDFYLVVSALAPYKKVDHAIEACRIAGRPLKIIGTGQEMKKLIKAACGRVEFLGWQSDDAVRDHYRRAKALLFPQLEDFGIVPLEAMACGCPVIAYAQGGALETVPDAADDAVAAPCGLRYQPQTPQALADAIGRFETAEIQDRLNAATLRRHAEAFSPDRFVTAFKRIVEPLLADKGWKAPWQYSL